MRPVLLLIIGCLISGCATYSKRTSDLRPDLAGHHLDAALDTVDSIKRSKDRLLYHLERGLILHYSDRWVDSNNAFADAERLAIRANQLCMIDTLILSEAGVDEIGAAIEYLARSADGYERDLYGTDEH